MRKQRIDTRSFMRLADIFVQSAAKLRFGKPHVPGLKRSELGARTMRDARQKKISRRKINSILARRERLLAEVALPRRRGEASRFIENAQQLLTRWWSTTSWDGREKLLNSADWLVRLEKRREI
jgi:hypothetical protein